MTRRKDTRGLRFPRKVAGDPSDVVAVTPRFVTIRTNIESGVWTTRRFVRARVVFEESDDGNRWRRARGEA